MVARTPPPKLKKPNKMVAPLDPNQLRQTLNKVEKCMERLQELQYITTNAQKSQNGKLPTKLDKGEWKRMSLPAMLLVETVGEIVEASHFARKIAAVADTKRKKITIASDPKTPVTDSYRRRLKPETAELNARRKREKQIIRSDYSPPLLQRASSRIHFKVSPNKEMEKENFIANRVSPKHRPWAKKTVIFPNPLFHNSKSPVVSRNRPHKFLIKTPPPAKSSSVAKFKVKIKSPIRTVSPTRPVAVAVKKVSTAEKIRRSFSPSRLATKLASPKIRRSFSPSKLATKLASPLKSRKLCLNRRSSIDGNGNAMIMTNMMSGLKQRPGTSSSRI